MTPKLIPAAALGLLLALAGCTSAVPVGESPSATAGASAGTDAATDTPQVDRDPAGELPEVTFTEGVPTMTTVSADPPTVISVKTITAGEGAVVGDGDYVSVNYAGFLWSDGSKFDSSYDSGQAAGFSLNQVVDGWRYGLAGTKVGDRALVVVPPEYGYGDQASETIPAGSTLVFVVDVLGTTPVSTESLTSAKPTDATLPAGLTVEGDLGKEPKLSFAAGSSAPAEPQVVVLAEGTGATISETDTLLYHIVGGYWGEETSSTWSSAYQKVAQGGGEATVGKKVGSRVLMTYPADASAGTGAQVLVIDIMAAVSGQ